MRIDPSEFTQTKINILSKRAGQTCSNPSCRKPTSGGHSEGDKAIVVGEAAHIHGQRPGSKRYDPTMNDIDRSNISNGIWLCGNCHKMIDTDEIKYPARLLFQWKYEHEGSVLDGNSGQVSKNNSVLRAILNELKENILVANNVLKKGNYSVKMSNESWNTYKGEFGFMSEETQTNLREVYSLVGDFNGLIDYNMYKLSHGAGYVDDKIRQAAEAYKAKVESVIISLQEL